MRISRCDLPFAMTYSALNTFVTCPRKYQAQYVTNEVKYSQSPAAVFGTWLHNALDDLISNGVDCTEFESDKHKTHYQYARDTIHALIYRPERKLLRTEDRRAIDADLHSVDYQSKDAIFRGITDVFAKWSTVALMADYKTGKPYPSSQQRWNALCYFAAYPDLETLYTVYIHTASKQVANPECIRRSHVDTIYAEITAVISQVIEAYKTNTWPAKRNPLCRGYCDVTSCPHQQH